MDADNLRISFFNSIRDVVPAGEMTIREWIRKCASEETKVLIAPIRKENGERVKQLKSTLPVATMSGTFNTRSKDVPLADKLTSYNGIICLDFDEVGEKRMTAEQAQGVLRAVSQDLPYVYYASLSASGCGVYALALTDNTDPALHGLYWRAMAEDIKYRIDLTPDPATKDVARTRYLSYGEARFNAWARPFTLPESFRLYVTPPPEECVAPTEITPDRINDVEACVAEFERRGIVLGENTYDTRFRIGTALKWLPGGLDFYRRICAGCTHHRTPEEEYAHFPAPSNPPQTGVRPITLAGFFYEMRLLGITPPQKEHRLPLDGLAGPIRAIVDDVAGAYQCQPEFVVASMYAAVAAVAGKKFQLVTQGYKNYCQLWIADVALAGDGKTPQMSFIMRPVVELDNEIETAYAAQYSTWEQGDHRTPPPECPAYIIYDATPEARDVALHDNPNGAIMYVDEISQMLADFGRYNPAGEVERWLTIFSNGCIKIKRKTQRTINIPDACCSIYGGTQPGTLARVFGKPEFLNRGFFGRWLWVWPPSMQRTYAGGHAPSRDTTCNWRQIIRNLAKHPGAGAFTLSPDAEMTYGEWWDEIESRRTSLPPSDLMREVYGKITIHALRWALITQLMTGKGDEKAIGEEVMSYTIQCMEYFLHTAEKVVKTLLQATKDTPHRITDAVAIRHLADAHPVLARRGGMTRLADVLGVTPQYVSGVLRKDDVKH